MTLQNDRWIREQCTPPLHVVTYAVPQRPADFLGSVVDLVCRPPVRKEVLSQLTADELIALMREGNNVVDFRPVRPADLKDWKSMIEPFEPDQVRFHTLDGKPAGMEPDVTKVISYGTSSYGYDIRCSDEFKVFTNIHSTVVDPKNFDEKSFVDMKGPYCIIPPNSFALARTVEHFRIPRNVMTVCLGKSTYARCGIIVNVTPFEPEWEGYVTLEFSNTTPLPAKIYANEGCAQVLFFENPQGCDVSYKDRGGKYQSQVGVTLPKA